MRVFALVVRAGAVVVAAGLLFSFLVHGAPKPRVDAASAAPAIKTQLQHSVKKKPASRGYPQGVVTIAATGDIVMGSMPNMPPDGGQTFFDGVKTDLAADVVFGNLEGTLSTAAGSKCAAGSTNCYAFETPPSYARWLKDAGFTVLNTANNHAFDYGATGQAQTLAALDRNGLLHTGRPGEITIQRVGAIRVALLGFSTYPWTNNMNNIAGVKSLVAKAAHEADVVVVAMHTGAEGIDHQHVRPGTETFLGENRGDPMRFAHAAIDAGADLIVGSGPHVLRGMQWYKGRLIAYSLGNFGGYKVFALGGPLSVSGILRVALRGDGAVESGVLVPTRLTADGVPALDPAEQAHGIVRTLSREDFGATAVKISTDGELSR